MFSGMGRLSNMIETGISTESHWVLIGEGTGKGAGTGLTDTARKHLLVIDVALDPGHQVFDVLGSGHFGWPFVFLRILPEILKPVKAPRQPIELYASKRHYCTR